MAAVSLAANVEFVENLFLSALVGGATVLSAQYSGRGDKRTVERIFGLILRCAAVISVIFTVTAIAAPEKLMWLFTDESALIPIGAEYIRMAAGSYLFAGISQCYLCIMKTTGQTKQSVIISSFALCLDTVLNAFFIFGLHMEASGAALTTSVTRAVELAIVLVYSKNMAVKPKVLQKNGITYVVMPQFYLTKTIDVKFYIKFAGFGFALIDRKRGSREHPSFLQGKRSVQPRIGCGN